MVRLMASFLPRLFLGPVDEPPRDNLDLERLFRQPKGHKRRIHGQAGVQLVREGPTLACELDAHQQPLDPFIAAERAPFPQSHETRVAVQ